MKHLFLTLLLATLCVATGYGQTLKSLMYNTTNGVVANTGTNLLTFVSTTNQSFSPVKFRDLDSGQEMQIVLADEALAAGYSAVRGSIGNGDGNFQIKYGTNSTEWGYPLIFASIEEGVWQTVSPATTTNDSYRFNRSISFDNTTNAATTRTNLGLGGTNSWKLSSEILLSNNIFYFGTNAAWALEDNAVFMPISFENGSAGGTRTNLSLGGTNIVTFAGLTNNGDITINQTATNNGLLYIRRTNSEPFLGLANLMASNNTTISNETLFRVGVAEDTNKSSQFGFRSTNTNGNGVAVFSVFGYNALMMIGPSDPAAGTNPIQATVYSVAPTNKVMTLITTNTGAMLMHRPIGIDTAGVLTNAPANTTNVAGWIEFYVGTNSVRVPYYQ